MNCIFCGTPVLKNSLEHIVPESLGNKTYTLENGFICGGCNNSFSKFEDKALSKGILAITRPMSGFATKKGKPAKGQSHGIKFEGNKKYIKNQVTVFGLTEKNVKAINSDGSIVFDIQNFDKSEMAVSKLLLKIGFEALFQSQRKVFKLTNLNELKAHLNKQNNTDWPFITTNIKPMDFQSIPRFKDKQTLKKINCEILFKKIDKENLLFNFRYSFLSYIINLINRDKEWIIPYKEKDKLIGIYPQ
jgi:hypothetical protein